jgi:hypothetical protein
MLPNDASLGELLAVWPTLADDMETINALMPDDIAEGIVQDFTSVRDELLRRQRIVRLAEPFTRGHDGCMYHLGPPNHPPPDLD